MNDSQDQSDFEHQLADLLHSRAAVKEVHQDLDAVIAAPVVDPQARQPSTRIWWFAAAALLLIGGVGLSRLTSEPDSTISTESSSAGDEASDPPVAQDGTELLVWLKSDATPSEADEIAGLLFESPVVVEIQVLDHDGVLEDFADHFAEVADGVELIDPASPPAAFKVLTTNPGDVGDLVTGTSGLDGVENSN